MIKIILSISFILMVAYVLKIFTSGHSKYDKFIRENQSISELEKKKMRDEIRSSDLKRIFLAMLCFILLTLSLLIIKLNFLK